MTSFPFIVKVYLDGANSLPKLNSGLIPGRECSTSNLAVSVEQSDRLPSCLLGEL